MPAKKADQAEDKKPGIWPQLAGAFGGFYLGKHAGEEITDLIIAETHADLSPEMHDIVQYSGSLLAGFGAAAAGAFIARKEPANALMSGAQTVVYLGLAGVGAKMIKNVTDEIQQIHEKVDEMAKTDHTGTANNHANQTASLDVNDGSISSRLISPANGFSSESPALATVERVVHGSASLADGSISAMVSPQQQADIVENSHSIYSGHGDIAEQSAGPNVGSISSSIHTGDDFSLASRPPSSYEDSAVDLAAKNDTLTPQQIEWRKRMKAQGLPDFADEDPIEPTKHHRNILDDMDSATVASNDGLTGTDHSQSYDSGYFDAQPTFDL